MFVGLETWVMPNRKPSCHRQGRTLTAFVGASGICELRVEPLYKANRPAVLFTCNKIVSTYIGESAPCRVDIGQEAEDALVKEVRSQRH